MTRREFVRFFLCGGFLAFIARNVGSTRSKPKKGMFWRRSNGA